MNFTETQILHPNITECSNEIVKKLAEDWLELNMKIKQLENINQEVLGLLKFKNFPIKEPI